MGQADRARSRRAIDDWLELTPIERAAALPRLRKVVLTDKDTLRVSAGQTKAEPHYEAHAGRLAILIGELLRIQNGARLAADMAAGLRAGQAFAAAYTSAKRAAGVADFNDLIDWTRRCSQPGMGDWVRYKLDRQIDHVLVDEAQDTNAAQWEIIERLVEEFFSGSSETEQRLAHPVHGRRLQAGDLRLPGHRPATLPRGARGFQAPRGLAARRGRYAVQPQRAREFRDLSIAASFRSAQPVLDVVDAVIATLGHAAWALTRTPAAASRASCGSAGQVELWAPFAVEEARDDERRRRGALGQPARPQLRRVLAERIRATGR